MAYHAFKHRVHDRGVAPDAFLDEMIAWGTTAPADAFGPDRTSHGIYLRVLPVLGPWRNELHKRAVMLEVMRVLAGFESSWKWGEGTDMHAKAHRVAAKHEAGA